MAAAAFLEILGSCSRLYFPERGAIPALDDFEAEPDEEDVVFLIIRPFLLEFEFPEPTELQCEGVDYLEETNDETYYLNQEKVDEVWQELIV